MLEEKLNVTSDDSILDDELDETPQALFPEVYNVANLKIDTKLPILKFYNLEDSITTKNSSIKISVQVPSKIRRTDLYLFVNKKKIDMFYQVSSGKYEFKNVSLINGENLIELFYRIGNKRSSSIYSVINKE